MFKEFKTWMYRDRFNICLALLCAVISVLPAIVPAIPPFFTKGFTATDSAGSYNNTNFWFSCSQCVIALIGLCIISARYAPVALSNLSDQSSLQDYIEEECRIKQTKKNDSLTAYRVVKTVIQQFYGAWIFVWAIWLLYYGVEMYYWSNIPCDSCSNNMKRLYVANFSSIKFLLDFLSSSALFGVYIVLNNITAEISNRCEKHYSLIYWAVIGIVTLFTICLVFHILYMTDPYNPQYTCYELYISIILGAFGCVSFVLVLGKLNSNYLDVPRLFILPLYIYAVAQAYSFFYGGAIYFDESNLKPVLNVIHTIYPFIMSIGKVVLLITLSWILYRKRLIFYIVHRSLSMTQIKDQLKEFNRYMGQ